MPSLAEHLSSSAPGGSLAHLLISRFGHPAFRANQEAVCRAAVDGHDVLLVMPTGAGKSLCYQLPAVARGGTALVVSPLIALMDDQAARLASLGFAVARIHSGLDRAASRQACVDYLNGDLQFLLIAPERLRVPGFGAMLAKRKPSLIAIDEAHCISQWGHDFRPDYRMLGQHLPPLRPAPVIALTATATPVVQNDIVAQLQLERPHRFIHGFRRDNLSIEVVEVAKPRRHAFVAELLSAPERRPAIVYAPTRRDAEALAVELGEHFPTAAYHAGLDPDHRERVQHHFLGGRLEAVVATIAFGMGVDKSDIRFVAHFDVPRSIEAYYQEIGRAGRDGRNSRTILLHSYADRRTHEFFLERDYPKVEELDRIYRLLRPDPQHADDLRRKLDLDEERFAIALEKLAIHGAAVVDFSGHAALGSAAWRQPYAAQAMHRRSQMDLVTRYAEGSQCRMAALVSHFGDTADGRRPCGHCDICSPERAIAQRFRPPTEQEHQAIQGTLKALRKVSSLSTGKLYKELFPRDQLSRNDFEKVLGALAAAGLLALEEASFEKDRETIIYRKASLTREGEELREGERIPLLLRDSGDAASTASAKSRKRAAISGPGSDRRSGTSAPRIAAASSASSSAAQKNEPSPNPALEEKLRAWRTAEAKKLNLPPFFILSDRTLRAIAGAAPHTERDLLSVDGIGPGKVQKFGAALCSLCRES